jgi:hypothetical protein
MCYDRGVRPEGLCLFALLGACGQVAGFPTRSDSAAHDSTPDGATQVATCPSLSQAFPLEFNCTWDAACPISVEQCGGLDATESVWALCFGTKRLLVLQAGWVFNCLSGGALTCPSPSTVRAGASWGNGEVGGGDVAALCQSSTPCADAGGTMWCFTGGDGVFTCPASLCGWALPRR